MGLILDTSILIEAERDGQSVEAVLARFTGGGLIAISTVTLMELSHGIARAKHERMRIERRRFLDAVRATIAVIPLDELLAIRAGLLNGQLAALGFTIGFADAIISATALSRGDSVATRNVRHFDVVPGLDVVGL